MNKVILYIATSQDGFIADKNGGVDWLPQPKNEQELEEVGYNKLMERIDIIIMGRKSYEQIIGFGDWGWKDKHTYVFSSQILKIPFPFLSISVTTDTPVQFMQKMKYRKQGKDIWLLGGASLAKSFDQENLIDEIILTVVPTVLNKGIPLIISWDHFKLIDETKLMDGIIQKKYIQNNLEGN